MKISKKDALAWFSFFAALPDEEEPGPRQQEIIEAVLTQIESAAEARFEALKAEIPHLKTMHGRTLYVGPEDRFAGGCRSCLLGTGLSAVRKTNRCNLNCPFCYDFGEMECQPPVGEGLWEIGGSRYYERDLDLLLDVYGKPTGVSYVYLEPFMEIEKYYGIISRFREAGVYQHMYTNGTLCTKENLTALAGAGLDELRFNLGASGCSDQVIESMKTAAGLFPAVGIETPMTPQFLKAFEAKKSRILETGVRFMNCAELHLNPNNLGNYLGAPMYLCRRGYLSPVWSREITFRLMAEADRENWGIAVHDCSNMTKFARDMSQRAHEGGWFGSTAYHCEFDRLPFEAFLPILETDDYPFPQEEPLPEGYRPSDLVF